MTYPELLVLLRAHSDPEDWLINDGKGIFTLKADLDVRLQREHVDLDAREPFGEEWATRHPDPNAYSLSYELWYRSSFVKSYRFVSVDGSRADLPLPKSAVDLTVTAEQASIAHIVNESGNRSYFLDYFSLFKVSTELPEAESKLPDTSLN